MSTEENKALVRRFEEEVWNGRNPSLVDEFFAASHVFRAAGSPPLDREGHRQMIAHFQSAFPDGQNTTDDLIADGDKVVHRWTLSRHPPGRVPRHPADRQAGDADGHQHLALRRAARSSRAGTSLTPWA